MDVPSPPCLRLNRYATRDLTWGEDRRRQLLQMRYCIARPALRSFGARPRGSQRMGKAPPLHPLKNPQAAATDHRDSLRPEVQPERRSALQAAVVFEAIAPSEATVSKLDAPCRVRVNSGPADADGSARRRLPIAPFESTCERPRRCRSREGPVTAPSVAGLLVYGLGVEGSSSPRRRCCCGLTGKVPGQIAQVPAPPPFSSPQRASPAATAADSGRLRHLTRVISPPAARRVEHLGRLHPRARSERDRAWPSHSRKARLTTRDGP
jgi:hypothetical protein